MSIKDNLSDKLAQIRERTDKILNSLLLEENDNIDVIPDMAERLRSNGIDHAMVLTNTELSGQEVEDLINRIKSNDAERKEIVQLQNDLNDAQFEIKALQKRIIDRESENNAKRSAIQKLEMELLSLRSEIEKRNKTADQDAEKIAQLEQELAKVERELNRKQKAVQNTNEKVLDLKQKLVEMTNYKNSVDGEYNDLLNREKPEVRQLLLEVDQAKQVAADSTAKVTRLQKRVTTKRKEIDEILNSDEMKMATDLKIDKSNLERRLRKWKHLNNTNDSLLEIETYSKKFAFRRNTLKQSVNTKERDYLDKGQTLQSLTSYEFMLDMMLEEHKTNFASAESS